MDKFLILGPLFKKIMDGSLFNVTIGWVLRVSGLLMAPVIIYASVQMWQVAAYAPALAIVAMVLIQVILLGLAYALFNLLWIRGTDVLALSLDADFSATPLFVMLIKVSGEVLAIVLCFLGLIGALAIWLAGDLSGMIPVFGDMNGFVGGLLSLVGGPVFGLLTLLGFYFLAEMTGAIVAIARNTRK